MRGGIFWLKKLTFFNHDFEARKKFDRIWEFAPFGLKMTLSHFKELNLSIAFDCKMPFPANWSEENQQVVCNLT